MKVIPPPPRALPAQALRPGAPVAARPAALPASRPAAAVLQRHSGFGQLSLDLRRAG